MKKRIIMGVVLTTIVSCLSITWAIEGVINREEFSLKAGPTEPGEGLALVWLEALVYPKVVKNERAISLGVRTASPVRKVEAIFDFSPEKVALVSVDGLNWNGACRLPNNIASGLHWVRYKICGSKNSIQRTVEFFVSEKVKQAKEDHGVSYGEISEFRSFPLTVTSTCSVLVGGRERIIFPGQKIKGLTKIPWYRIELEDGSLSWISSLYVNDPVEECLKIGIEAYNSGNFPLAQEKFNTAIALDSRLAKGYYWLAKTYDAQNEIEKAADALMVALELDAREMEFRKLSASLAKKFSDLGDEKFEERDFRGAAAAFRRVLDLSPSSTKIQVKLAKCLEKFNPKEINSQFALKKEKGKKPAETPIKKISEESLALVRTIKTHKGSNIESAIKSVVSLTRSLGTPVVEKGWRVKALGEKFLVSYLCEQGKGVLESFDWLVDVDTRQVLPGNENARLLMSRW